MDADQRGVPERMGHDLRSHAATLRRGADRLTLLRMRPAHVVAAAAEEAGEDAALEALHERWTLTAYPALGRAAAELRRRATVLEETATDRERRSGRRLGGYTGAGFLGRGEEAGQQVREVARFMGAEHGAGIGGFPLPAGEAPRPLHVSDQLGQATPEIEDEDA